jgi:dTDP-4-amino-4,6-dideoxygalactose transaminase
MKVPFNKPYLPETVLAGADVLRTLGKQYDACRALIKKNTGFEHVILTPSCTSALELIALSLNIKPGDEVILPSYTFVSTANAFALRGAKLVFVDTYDHHPSIDLRNIEKAITPKTKAIVVVHYGGIAIDYLLLKKLKKKYSIPIVEDAAHCFGSRSGESIIGSVGDFAAFSFHETKNISCGQGGVVIINNKKYLDKAYRIAQCGTNKTDFINKKVKFYSWQEIGSNYLMAEPLCAILLAGLKLMKKINHKRVGLCKKYYNSLQVLEKKGDVQLGPYDPDGNGHIFYMVTKDLDTRDRLISFLKKQGIEATFHYAPLHLTAYYLRTGAKKSLPQTEYFSERLVRLPLFYGLTETMQQFVISNIKKFYQL